MSTTIVNLPTRQYFDQYSDRMKDCLRGLGYIRNTMVTYYPKSYMFTTEICDTPIINFHHFSTIERIIGEYGKIYFKVSIRLLDIINGRLKDYDQSLSFLKY